MTVTNKRARCSAAQIKTDSLLQRAKRVIVGAGCANKFVSSSDAIALPASSSLGQSHDWEQAAAQLSDVGRAARSS